MVLQFDGGSTTYQCGLDEAKAAHAFGARGKALAAVARELCTSLTEHWKCTSRGDPWVPPFEGARIARETEFSAQSAAAAIAHALEQHSALHTLLAAYEIAAPARNASIVAAVQREVRRNRRTEHLAPRFNRQLVVSRDAAPLKVDFLGQHYACYFLQVSQSERGIEASAERAYGKLFELDALRRFVKQRPKSLGLLDDERPQRFELIVVGDREHAVQRRALAQIEALADRNRVIARPLANAASAADHVIQQERRAA